jgi:hypothetical protein
MPEEIEIPTEHLHEEIQEKAGEMREKWILYVALSTAFMARCTFRRYRPVRKG